MLWSLTPETKEIWDTGLTLHLKTYDFSSVVGEVVCSRFQQCSWGSSLY